MKVTTIRSMPEPEQLVCEAARGDYYDGFIGDTDIDELVESVPYEERHVDAVQEIFNVYEDGEWAGRTVGEETDIVAHESYDGLPAVENLYRQYALLERLFRRGHWGPFEHPRIVIGVKGVSRSCMAQITRHRHASFDVQSMRYVNFSDDASVETPRSLTDDDHATRGEGVVEVPYRKDVKTLFEQNAEKAVETYKELVESGVPKEDARFILPIGTTVNFTIGINARSLLHIEDMRKTGEAQWEVRDMTERIHDEFESWMPMTAHLYEEHGPHQLAP